MAKVLNQLSLDNFASGLNTVDSPHDMRDSDLKEAANVIYRPTGEVESIDPPLQVGNEIRVNSIVVTKILGGAKFNGSIYLMASNGTVARMVKKATLAGSITAFADAGGGQVTVTSAAHNLNNGDSVTIIGTTNYNGTFTIASVTTNTYDITDTFNGDDATGTWNSVGWTEVSAVDFDANTKIDVKTYNSKLWFVNGLTTNSNVLHFISTGDVLTGLTTASGLEAGINRIALHLERMWISKGNKIFVSKQFAVGANSDWDATRVYAGSNAPGLIQIDDNPLDSIVKMITYFGQLVVFRDLSIHLITGKTILTSTLTKALNSQGCIADFSVAMSDISLYFLSVSGVKQLRGNTVQDKTNEFDSISSIGIDRKIRTEIDAFADKSAAVSYAFKDKFYISDAVSFIYSFDEATGGWSKFDSKGAEVFIEDGDDLFFAIGSKYYQLFGDTSGSVTSSIRTKDFNLGTDNFQKLFEKITATFKALTAISTFTLEWYLNGASNTSGTKSITITGTNSQWDAGFKWDSGVKWDSGTIDFFRENQRKLKTGISISFGFRATGTNRFSLSSLDLLYENTRRDG
tara:strand:- start:2834 stop:4555 length:1722 start_codon:yes stop_codon:yes gene_type:complete